MRRRDVINGIAGLLTAWPIVARGQPAALPVVGFLGPGSAESDAYREISKDRKAGAEAVVLLLRGISASEPH